MRVARTLPIILLFLAGCRTFDDVAPHRAFRVIGYVRGRAGIDAIGAKKLTHLNYAFAKVNPLGVIWFEDPDAPAHIAQLQALKAKNPDLKVIVSVGGWGADFFSDAAVDDPSRCRFADSAVDMIKRYALDGIDLDWEYPGQPGPGIRYRAEDKQNFTLMLRTLRDELDMLSDARGRKGFDRYTISIASAGGEHYFANVDMSQISKYVDWFNVMTYDFEGEWSKVTGHHTALYPLGQEFVREHLAAGIPSRKIVLGAAFYGRGWRGVGRQNTGLSQPYDQPESDYPYSRITREFLGAPGYQRRWDPAAGAPYLWNAEAGRFITYDDPQSLREKARFVRTHHLGGIMYWEHSEDPTEVLLDAIVSGLR